MSQSPHHTSQADPVSLPIRHISTQEILAKRPAKQLVDPAVPYAFLVEPECAADGTVRDVATLFLSNAECPFHCLMCDLWKQTLDRRGPPAEIAKQIRYALERLPSASSIKLYNSGNFFDPVAISPGQYADIAQEVQRFETVIVENHPRLTTERCLAFRDLIAPAQLEVAIGLETAHPELLAALNKQMTLEQYDNAVRFLVSHNIAVRTFLLLRPPFLSEAEGVDWAIRSLTYAFDRGVECCSLVPTRAGNGVMETLEATGEFSAPSGASMEFVLEQGLSMKRGRVLMDLWDAQRFFVCADCKQERIARLNRMNLTQMILPRVQCQRCGG